MPTFGELCYGDMFNTKTGRWVKTDDKHAVCVMGALFGIGEIYQFAEDRDVIVLYTANRDIQVRVSNL